MMRGGASASAQRVASATIVTGVGEGTGPAGQSGGDWRDHSPEWVAFKGWARGGKGFLPSCRGLGANQRRNCPNSGAFKGGFQWGYSHLRYRNRRGFLGVFIAL